MTTSPQSNERPGERRFAFDANVRRDANLIFIGRVRSPWTDRAECPKNVRQARERGCEARVEIEAAWREGLGDLRPGQFVHLLTWLDRARRDLAVQSPRHAAEPRGTFTIRSPVRPNPIGMHLVQILAIDTAAGLLRIDAIDVLDDTPLLDIKPYLASVDAPPATASDAA